MNLEALYHRLIEDRRAHPVEGYSERHHIVPRCDGGGDEPENLVRLSARDHLFAHLILAKWKGGLHWATLNYAMTGVIRAGRTPTAQELRIAAKARGRYQFTPEIKAKQSAALQGRRNGMFGVTGSANPAFKSQRFTLRHSSGGVEEGTHNELVRRLNLGEGNFTNLKSKPRRCHVQGWSIIGVSL